MPVRDWDDFYTTSSVTDLSWYEDVPTTLADISDLGLTPAEATVLDVGGGVSTLAEHLVERGYGHVTVLDLAATAASTTSRDPQITRVTGDVRSHSCEGPVDLWHDRATFHFLTELEDQIAYKSVLAQCLKEGGSAVIATFAPAGPTMCAGRNVARYSEDELVAEFAGTLDPVACRTHVPADSDSDQRPYTICQFTKASAD